MIRRPPRSPLFPYTPLFRSAEPAADEHFAIRLDGSGKNEVIDTRKAGQEVGRQGATRLQAREIAKRSEEHTSELQSRLHLVCRLLLEKKKTRRRYQCTTMKR